jgi:hypothetical protein
MAASRSELELSARVLAVQVLNRSGCISARHFHEAEAAWPSRITIHDQGNRIDRAVLCK